MKVLSLLGRFLTLSIPTLVIAACFSPRPTEAPIPSKFYKSGNGSKEHLVVFLPGRGDDIDSYERGGFIDALARSEGALDSVVVDAHLGYYIKRTLGERVYEDVLVPYREKGYRHFILVGISLGGVGALRLNEERPEMIAGTVLIAPFLGSKSTIESVRQAGGVKNWRQQVTDPLSPEEQIWTWIDNMYDSESAAIPCTVLAYGRKDSFAPAGDYFAEMLPESHVFTNDGGHKWVAWGPLWSDILASRSWLDLGCTLR
jgi:pimeloyl-ACP methyl ester carboxylesterase